MLNKYREATYKALEGDGRPAGTFSAIVAVFGNVDKQGDRVLDGAFDQTLKSWQASGDPIPIVLAHQWKDPFSHIGVADPFKVKSVPGIGLVVEEGVLDILDNPLAAQVHKLMQRRSLKEFSFGYGIPKGGQEKARDGAFNLKALDLIEFGPCLKGVNDQTQLLNIKSMLEGEPSFEDRLARLESTISTFIEGKSALAVEEVELEQPDEVIVALDAVPDLEDEEPKAILTQAEYDEASDEVKSLYEDIDGIWTLIVEPEAVEEEDPAQKSMDVDAQIRLLQATTGISNRESLPAVKSVIEADMAADEYLKRMEAAEKLLT